MRTLPRLRHPQGVTSQEIVVPPLPLTPTYLHETCKPEISLEQSKAIYELFKWVAILRAGCRAHLLSCPQRMSSQQARPATCLCRSEMGPPV